MTIKVAIVGCGRIGTRHAGLLAEHKIDGAELVAVCDILKERAIGFGREHHVPYFTNMCLMAEIVKPDLIAVCTPSGHHANHVLMLARYDAALLVEKPLTLRLADLDKVVKTCQQKGIILGEVKQNRYNVAVQHLKQALDAGRLGVPRLASVRVWWSRDERYYQDWHGTWGGAGGVLANQAIHHVDLLWWLLGNVKRVSAVATYSDYTDVETGLCATLEFESGCIGTIEATTLARPYDLEGSLAILGDRGTVELGGFAVNEIRVWVLGSDDEGVDVKENPPDVYGFGHLKLYEDVVKCLRDGRELPVNGAEARKALEIVHAIYQSVEMGETIELGSAGYPGSRLGKFKGADQ